MSYRIIRVLLCDIPECDTPSPYVLQGEDDAPLTAGWVEHVVDGVKIHTCPSCAANSRTATEPKSIY